MKLLQGTMKPLKKKSSTKRKTAAYKHKEKKEILVKPSPLIFDPSITIVDETPSQGEEPEEAVEAERDSPMQEPQPVSFPGPELPAASGASEPAPEKNIPLEEDTQRRDLQGQIEAILFAAGKPMGLDTIAILTGARRGYVKKALQALKEQYEKKNGALFLFEEGENWKFSVKERFSPLIRKIVPDTELSKSILETLAIIAWKSPVSQAELVRIRSTKVYDHVPQLEESGFVMKERKGRTYQLKITQKFYDYFELEGHDQIRQVFHGIPEKQEEKAKINEMREEIRKEMHEQQKLKVEEEKKEQQKITIPGHRDIFAPEETAKEDALPDPDEDMDEFLKKIDERIEGIAQSHDSIEMKRESYGFEKAMEQQPAPEESAEAVHETEEEAKIDATAETQSIGEEPQQIQPEETQQLTAEQEYDKRLAEKMQVAMEREKAKQEKAEVKEEEKKPPSKTQMKKKILEKLQALKDKPKRLSGLRRKNNG